MARENVRKKFASQFGAVRTKKAKALSKFIKQGSDGHFACWGGVAEYCDKNFDDDERIKMWDAFVASKDWRAQLLFIHFSRNRPAVMAKVLETVAELPVRIQQALVSLEEVADYVESIQDNLHPAARQLWEQGPEMLKRERQLAKRNVAKLMSVQYVTPNTPEE
ncbi:MAG: hypothetical protein GY854_25390 [Deltaproteobacteria bacterium]|nr:hypothetical protein [Deltaproteobacteria bacterium]